jgi:hypothetical protein
MAYGFKWRLKHALDILFRGFDANDITITSDDAKSIVVWISDWLEHIPKED